MYAQVSQRHAFLTIKNAEKSDGGIYRLDLENDLGHDSCNIEFTVNGKGKQLPLLAGRLFSIS